MAAETLQDARATVEDLYKVEGRAELINGRIVRIPLSSGCEGVAEGAILFSLKGYEKRGKFGRAYTGGVAFVISLPHRETVSPDAAFIIGMVPTMHFYEGAPVFAVEVRSEGDYGTAAEREIAAKRADYFAAGTQVVWDVDLLADEFVVKVYRKSDPDNPTGYRRGEIAEAEPAVRGWTMPVDSLFV